MHLTTIFTLRPSRFLLEISSWPWHFTQTAIYLSNDPKLSKFILSLHEISVLYTSYSFKLGLTFFEEELSFGRRKLAFFVVLGLSSNWALLFTDSGLFINCFWFLLPPLNSRFLFLVWYLGILNYDKTHWFYKQNTNNSLNTISLSYNNQNQNTLVCFQ